MAIEKVNTEIWEALLFKRKVNTLLRISTEITRAKIFAVPYIKNDEIESNKALNKLQSECESNTCVIPYFNPGTKISYNMSYSGKLI